jgi:N-acetylmuramoyl-L-alanine amidase
MTIIRLKDVTTMARTLHGEARGEPYEGKVAIAWVIRNRHENPGWWSRDKKDDIPDDTIEAVCRAPWQFTCWQDHNRYSLESTPLHDPVMAQCLAVAMEVLLDEVPDPTKGSTHYLNPAVVDPPWYKPELVKAIIGRHHFLTPENG